MKSSRNVPYLLFIFAALLMIVAVYMLGKPASVTYETSHPAANPAPPAATTSTSTNPASKPQDKASGASSALQSLNNPSFSAVSASVSSAKKDIRTLIVGTWRTPSPSGGKYEQIEFFPDGTFLDREYLTDEDYKGVFGTYTLDNNGRLTLSGTGTFQKRNGTMEQEPVSQTFAFSVVFEGNGLEVSGGSNVKYNAVWARYK